MSPARNAAGSIPDLDRGGSTYLTSTPSHCYSGKTPPPFRPADDADQQDDLLLLGSADRRRRRGHIPSLPPSGSGGAASASSPSFTTRSLPRSAKDFSTLYRPAGPSLTSLASLYQEEQEAAAAAAVAEQLLDVSGCCDRRKQLKMLQGLAREMNWSLPVDATATAAVAGLSIDDMSSDSAGVCSALSMSDTLLNDQLTSVHHSAAAAATSNSYARDFTYLSKPPPAYPRNSINNNNKTVPAAAAAATNEAANTRNPSSTSSSSSRRIKIRRALSRSHPDLSKLGKELQSCNGGGNSQSTSVWRALRHSK